jgi:hypothetical protein
MNTKILPLLLFLDLLFLGQVDLRGQQEVKINYVKVNEEEATVDVFINAKVNGKFVSTAELKIDSVYETKEGESREEHIRVRKLTNVGEDGEEAGADVLRTTVLFLLDRSGSMGLRYGNKMEEAKIQIKAVLDSLPTTGWAYFGAFSNELSPVEPLNASNFEEVVGTVQPASGEATWLNNAISDALDWIESRPGRKIIFLLTDGKDVAKQDNEFDPSRYVEQSELLNRAAELDRSFSIYTTGYGNKDQTANKSGIDEEFLKELTDSTKSLYDRYGYATDTLELKALLGGFSSDVGFNIKLEYQPTDLSYAGDRRNITIPYEFRSTGEKERRRSSPQEIRERAWGCSCSGYMD